MRLQKMAHADGLWYVTPRNEMSPWLVNSPLHVWCRYEIHTASGLGVMAPASTSILSDTVERPGALRALAGSLPARALLEVLRPPPAPWPPPARDAGAAREGTSTRACDDARLDSWRRDQAILLRMSHCSGSCFHSRNISSASSRRSSRTFATFQSWEERRGRGEAGRGSGRRPRSERNAKTTGRRAGKEGFRANGAGRRGARSRPRGGRVMARTGRRDAPRTPPPSPARRSPPPPPPPPPPSRRPSPPPRREAAAGSRSRTPCP